MAEKDKTANIVIPFALRDKLKAEAKRQGRRPVQECAREAVEAYLKARRERVG